MKLAELKCVVYHLLEACNFYDANIAAIILFWTRSYKILLRERSDRAILGTAVHKFTFVLDIMH